MQNFKTELFIWQVSSIPFEANVLKLKGLSPSSQNPRLAPEDRLPLLHDSDQTPNMFPFTELTEELPWGQARPKGSQLCMECLPQDLICIQAYKWPHSIVNAGRMRLTASRLQRSWPAPGEAATSAFVLRSAWLFKREQKGIQPRAGPGDLWGRKVTGQGMGHPGFHRTSH